MECIFYEDAARLLGVSISTLKQAIIERGVFTRVGRQGRNMMLIKEQVLLFKGPNPRTGHKKRLSFEALTPAERKRWQELADATKETSAEQEIPIEQLEAIIDERVASQVEPVMQALKGVSGIVNQWEASQAQKREVPQGRPFPPRVKVRVPLPA